MKAIPTRLQQIQLIAFGYASLLIYAAYEWYVRHLAELQNPIDAQGGMWAFGDELLSYYLFFLFLVPTVPLLRLMSKSDSVYNTYARFALAFALTAPLSALLLACNISKVSAALGEAALLRLFRSPMVLVPLLMSRIFAHQKTGKRLMNWAIFAEGATIASSIVFLVLASWLHL